VGGSRTEGFKPKSSNEVLPKLNEGDSTMNAGKLSQEGIATQSVKVLYTAKTHTTGGRDGGASRTSDGRLDVKLSRPGGPGEGTNPEQLLAVGWSSCFLSALKIVASQMKVRLQTDPVIDAEIDLCSGDDGYSLKARFNISLSGVEQQVAQSIVDGAEQTCPYSKAMSGNVEVAMNLI
jgi:lipoyl-dependent peroxiredoxin